VAVIPVTPRRQRQLWASMFALAVSVVLLAGVYIGAYVTGSIGTLTQSFSADAGEYYVYPIWGTTWSMMRISLHSEAPVTVCITDSSGLEMLRSGGEAFCLFRASDVTELDRVWRFPSSGRMYLVVLPKEETSVELQIKTGLVLP
jgi:molybdopterin-binding protein